MTAKLCRTAGGVLLLNSSHKLINDCSTNPCVVTGACCKPDGSCASLTKAACRALGGFYKGDGVSCTSCPDSNTSCCGLVGCCCCPDTMPAHIFLTFTISGIPGCAIEGTICYTVTDLQLDGGWTGGISACGSTPSWGYTKSGAVSSLPGCGGASGTYTFSVNCACNSGHHMELQIATTYFGNCFFILPLNCDTLAYSGTLSTQTDAYNWGVSPTFCTYPNDCSIAVDIHE